MSCCGCGLGFKVTRFNRIPDPVPCWPGGMSLKSNPIQCTKQRKCDVKRSEKDREKLPGKWDLMYRELELNRKASAFRMILLNMIHP